VLHREAYGFTEAEHGSVRAYDELMHGFYQEQDMLVPAGGWSLHGARRVESAAALRGRDALRTILGRLGFGLRGSGSRFLCLRSFSEF